MFWTKRPKAALLAALFITAFALCVYLMLQERRTSTYPDTGDLYFHQLLGSEESCMNCHQTYTGFSPGHQPQLIGCSPCHGGDPAAADLGEAHRGLILVPGNLSTINRTCGAANCHGDIAGRVKGSLMASMSGVVAVDRFVFGASDSLSALAHVRELGLDHAADVHLRQLCASCHLGNEKPRPSPILETSRGGGCVACHLDYSAVPAEQQAGVAAALVHPAINLKVTNDHCFGCHSRSGRISTNYEGWHETTLEAGSAPISDNYRLLADGRVFRRMAPDVHHQLGLECIDCHGAKELMGDGQRYRHQEEAVKVQCRDCHFSTPPATATYEELDAESRQILRLRGIDQGGAPFVRKAADGQALLNVLLPAPDSAVMVGKNSGRRYPLTPPADICTRGRAHDALSCSSCHTGWAPQCIGCHNTYEPKTFAFDQLDQRRVQGKWVEYVGEFFAEAPGLGVIETEELRKIKTFIPGMIMTIDPSPFPGAGKEETFHRLFAPNSAHTISSKGRSCTSCHNDPLALGYGRGTLTYEIEGKRGRWQFISEYEHLPQDGLPQDAWTGFLESRADISATRPGARPFSRMEQQRILQVGACLNCHQGGSTVMQRGLDNFDAVLREVSPDCVLPVWE